jgi:hypothetical protein
LPSGDQPTGTRVRHKKVLTAGAEVERTGFRAFLTVLRILWTRFVEVLRQ